MHIYSYALNSVDIKDDLCNLTVYLQLLTTQLRVLPCIQLTCSSISQALPTLVVSHQSAEGPVSYQPDIHTCDCHQLLGVQYNVTVINVPLTQQHSQYIIRLNTIVHTHMCWNNCTYVTQFAKTCISKIEIFVSWCSRCLKPSSVAVSSLQY